MGLKLYASVTFILRLSTFSLCLCVPFLICLCFLHSLSGRVKISFYDSVSLYSPSLRLSSLSLSLSLLLLSISVSLPFLSFSAFYLCFLSLSLLSHRPNQISRFSRLRFREWSKDLGGNYFRFEDFFFFVENDVEDDEHLFV